MREEDEEEGGGGFSVEAPGEEFCDSLSSPNVSTLFSFSPGLSSSCSLHLSEDQVLRLEPLKGFRFSNLYSVGLIRLSFLKALKISPKPQDLTSEIKHKRSEKVQIRVPPVNSSQSAVHYG